MPVIKIGKNDSDAQKLLFEGILGILARQTEYDISGDFSSPYGEKDWEIRFYGMGRGGRIDVEIRYHYNYSSQPAVWYGPPDHKPGPDERDVTITREVVVKATFQDGKVYQTEPIFVFEPDYYLSKNPLRKLIDGIANIIRVQNGELDAQARREALGDLGSRF